MNIDPTPTTDSATTSAEALHIPAIISAERWGTLPTGEPVERYTLTNDSITVTLTNFGAHIISIEAPDRDGKCASVVLGYKDLAGYLADNKTFIGSVVGRYGNRLAKGTFTLDGETYHVPLNNGPNALHGGPDGFDRKLWNGQSTDTGVELTLVSPDGDMGFPGELTAKFVYTLQGTTLRIRHTVTTTRPTVVNLTNHTYFNLGGEGSGVILDHIVSLAADRFVPVDSTLIPTGELAPVAGTPLDFRQPTAIGARIEADNTQLHIAGGYDHTFVLDGQSSRNQSGPADSLHLAANVLDPASGRTLSVETTEPGVQFYSGNFLTGTSTGASGVPYTKHLGFCLETQHFPDSPNHPDFPGTRLDPGQTRSSETTFTFGVQN